MNIAKLIAALLLFSAPFALWRCGETGSPGDQKDRTTVRAGELAFAVDESVEPIFEEYVALFETQNPKAKLNPVYTDEATAIKMFLQDTTLLAITARPLSTAQTEQFKARHKFAPDMKYFLMDAVVPIVHPDNAADSLTTGRLRQMLRGEIKTWRQADPYGAEKPIEIVFDRNGSSVLRYVQDSLLGGEKIAVKAYAAGSHEAVFREVAKKPRALGFVGFNWLSKETSEAARGRRDSVRMVALARSLDELPAIADSIKKYSPDAENFDYQLPAAPHYVDLSDYPLSDLTHNVFYKRWPMQRRVYFLKREPYNGLATGFAAYFAGREGQMVAHKANMLPSGGVSRLVQVEEKSAEELDKDGKIRSESRNPAPERPEE